MNQIYLKRAAFSNQIRRQAIQSKKRQIRQKMMSKFSSIEQLKEVERIQGCIIKCQEQNMPQLKIKIVLQMMLFSDVRLIITQRYVDFLLRILDVIHSRLYDSDFKNQTIRKIANITHKMITYSLGQQENPNQDIPISNCLNAILCVLEYIKTENFQCWITMSQITNIKISKAAVLSFINVVNYIPELTSELASVIIKTLQNFATTNLQTHFIQQHIQLHLLEKLSDLMDLFELIDIDLQRVATIISYFISDSPHTLQQKVQNILQRCPILKKVFNYLQRKNICHFTDQTLLVLIKLVGRVFSTSNQLSRKVWNENMDIIGSLRQCIPIIKINFSTKDQLIKYEKPPKLDIIKHIIFALSNIVATAQQFVQTFIKSDIFQCLLFIYHNSNQAIQSQISYVYLNIVLLSQSVHFEIMYDRGLLSFINQMLHQSCSQIIQQNALKMINSLACKVQSFSKLQNRLSQYTLGDYKTDLQEIGAYKFIEGLIVSKNQSISNIALSILERL